jgi:inner membrane protein
MQVNPLVTKAFALLAIVGLLMMALGRIGGLAEERQGRFVEAEQSVAQSQAGRQAVLGPALLSDCVEEWTTTQGEGKDRSTVQGKREFTLTATPQQLDVKAVASMEPRYRGLFKVNTYVTRTTMHARFLPLASLRPVAEHAGSRMSCHAPVLMVSVSDARGIRQAQVKIDGRPLPVEASTLHRSHPRGFHAVLPEAARAAEQPLVADVTVDLVGTAELALAPVAGDTRFELAADWPHPSFGGRFLPTTRSVRPDGFSATWQVSSLATTAPLDFARGVGLCAGEPVEGKCVETFNVGFIDPVNPYSLSDRAIKYGLLFIGLTFVAVAMVEVMRRLRVHPIQYMLVGCALSIFFLLLLSLSEHLAFALSYALAAGACVALLAAYGSYVLGGWRPGLLFGAGIAGLYGALYALLQMEQTAMVIGSVLLFVVLAAVMLLTRGVDWYGLLRGPAQPPVATP